MDALDGAGPPTGDTPAAFRLGRVRSFGSLRDLAGGFSPKAGGLSRPFDELVRVTPAALKGSSASPFPDRRVRRSPVRPTPPTFGLAALSWVKPARFRRFSATFGLSSGMPSLRLFSRPRLRPAGFVALLVVPLVGCGYEPNRLSTGYRYRPLNASELDRRAFYADRYSFEAREAQMSSSSDDRSPIGNGRPRR
jgi:hypothetical protein